MHNFNKAINQHFGHYFKSLLVFCLLSLSGINAHANLIFEFDNAAIPEVNFVGAEASGPHFYFAPNFMDIGDSFDLLIGALPGSNELAEVLDMHVNMDDVQGFGFGNSLAFVPVTEKFYVTVVRNSGNFSVSSVRIYFSNNGVGDVWQGVQIRNPVDVPEPSSFFLLILACTLIWLYAKVLTRHSV